MDEATLASLLGLVKNNAAKQPFLQQPTNNSSQSDKEQQQKQQNEQAAFSQLPSPAVMKILSFLDPSLQKSVGLRAAPSDFLPPVLLYSHLKKDATPKQLTVNELQQIEEQGFVVKDNLFSSSDFVQAVRSEVQDLYNNGRLRDAQMSTGQEQWNNMTFRGDKIMWLNNTETIVGSSPNLVTVLDTLQRIKLELNELCQFGSEQTQTQVACYPGEGTRYVRHLDSSRKGARRRLTCLYYLNPAWKEADGGQLRMYLKQDNEKDEEKYKDVEPLADRLLIFQSGRMEHEVLPSYQPRYAITMWFY